VRTLHLLKSTGNKSAAEITPKLRPGKTWNCAGDREAEGLPQKEQQSQKQE
jgi:hypothetical protein